MYSNRNPIFPKGLQMVREQSHNKALSQARVTAHTKRYKVVIQTAELNSPRCWCPTAGKVQHTQLTSRRSNPARNGWVFVNAINRSRRLASTRTTCSLPIWFSFSVGRLIGDSGTYAKNPMDRWMLNLARSTNVESIKSARRKQRGIRTIMPK